MAASDRSSTGTEPLALKGQLVPSGPFAMSRAVLDEELDSVARQVWVAHWSLPDGEEHRQPVLNYPGVNVSIEPDLAAVHLPTQGLAERVLSGHGWVAGVLLRPGAGSLVAPGEHHLQLGAALPIPDPEPLVGTVTALMDEGAAAADVVPAYQEWLTPLLGQMDDDRLLLNELCEVVEGDPTVLSTADLVARFGLTERSIQRLVRSGVGVSPGWLIRRRRLQEAAHRLREAPELALASLAAELGYSDQAHFTREFSAVVGVPPGRYRSSISR